VIDSLYLLFEKPSSFKTAFEMQQTKVTEVAKGRNEEHEEEEGRK
jgi:hypothetical protein